MASPKSKIIVFPLLANFFVNDPIASSVSCCSLNLLGNAMLKALLISLLEPIDTLRQMEIKGDYTSRLAMLEELKALPYGAVWNYYCVKSNVPEGDDWLKEVKDYENKVLNKRN